jgi:hypothetical protein
VSCATGLASMSSPPATAHGGGGPGPDKPHGKRLGGASGGKGAAASRGHGGGNGRSGNGEEQSLILAADSADVSKGGPSHSCHFRRIVSHHMCVCAFLYAVQAR